MKIDIETDFDVNTPVIVDNCTVLIKGIIKCIKITYSYTSITPHVTYIVQGPNHIDYEFEQLAECCSYQLKKIN